MNNFLFFFTIFLLFTYYVNGYNILVTVLAVTGSQNVIMYRLAEIFGKRGHNVTIWKKDFLKTKSPKLVYAKEISHSVIDDPELFKTINDNINEATWRKAEGDFSLQTLKDMKYYFRVQSNDCEKTLRNTEMMQKLKSENFDVIIIHYLDYCTWGLAHALGIKGTILMSTANMLDYIAWYSGSPSTPSYVVSGNTDITDRMTFSERMKNTLAAAAGILFQQFIEQPHTEVFQKIYGPEFPTLPQLMFGAQLFFINSDPFFEYPRPIPHNVVYVGGFTMENAEPLTEVERINIFAKKLSSRNVQLYFLQEWAKIVSNAGEHGVVIFSLGSAANTSFMPLDMKRAFINGFKRIPQTVIWRLEGDTSEARKVPNIRVTNWMPQKDLLGHPQVKAFITHGGYNSLTEATYLGVPLVVFPMFYDQYANARRVERMKIGVKLERDDLTEDTLVEALNTVLKSQEIQTNARRLGQMIRGKPESSYDLTVKWVEFLAEFQNLDQLKPASVELPLTQYFLVDVFFTLFLVSIVSFYISCKCCQLCVRKTICHGAKRKTE